MSNSNRKFVVSKTGVTIKMLKDYVRDLPEADEYGNPHELWVMTSPSTSSVATSLYPLNSGDVVVGVHDE